MDYVMFLVHQANIEIQRLKLAWDVLQIVCLVLMLPDAQIVQMDMNLLLLIIPAMFHV